MTKAGMPESVRVLPEKSSQLQGRSQRNLIYSTKSHGVMKVVEKLGIFERCIYLGAGNIGQINDGKRH